PYLGDYKTRVNIASITDGTSNTVAFCTFSHWDEKISFQEGDSFNPRLTLQLRDTGHCTQWITLGACGSGPDDNTALWGVRPHSENTRQLSGYAFADGSVRWFRNVPYN